MSVGALTSITICTHSTKIHTNANTSNSSSEICNNKIIFLSVIFSDTDMNIKYI
jgi:hypothetical protein